MNELTLIDTFSGIGGFSLAGDRAGFRTVCFSEVDPYASAVLRKHWPDVPNLGDITKADFTAYAGSTVLCGGFPCQPFSAAGKRRGKADDRYLWPSMLRAIRESRPTWIVGENVNGFINMGLADAASDLALEGYVVRPFIVPACAVGADHRRDRVWIVANAHSQGLQASRQRGETTQTESPSDAPSFPRREAYPGLLREVHGIPSRVDRIKSLGNSIVPQVAEQILKGIAAIERGG